MRRRSQSSVEYLALLVGILLLAVFVANLVLPSGIFSNSGPRSQFYWSSAWPFSIESYTIIDGSLVLNLHNGADDPLYVTGIRVAGAEHPLYNYSLTELGGSLCTEGPIGHYTCDPARIGAGKNMLIAAGGFGAYCTFGVRDFVLDNLSIEYTQGSVTGVLQSSNEKLAGSCGQQAPTPTPTPAPGQVYITGCQSLNRSEDIYTLTADAFAMLPSSAACFNITADNVTLDMNGYHVIGNNSEGAFGVWTSSNNSIVKNGNLQNFSVSVYSQGNFTTVFGNIISVPANSTANADKWQGIELMGNLFGNVSSNTVSVSAVGPGAACPSYPNGILMFGAKNSTLLGNSIAASGVANGIYMFANASTLSFSGYNSILSNNIAVSNGMGLFVNSTGGYSQNWNNLSLNTISSSGAGSGASFQYANNWSMVGNMFTSAALSSKSLFLVHSNSNSVLANSFYNSTPASFFVYLADASYNNLAGNTLSGAGFYLGGRNVYNNITGNTINTGNTAIQLVVAYYNGNLSNNNISFNSISTTGNGIYLALTGVYNNTFFSNNLKTSGIGISISGNVTSSFFDSNIVNSTANPSVAIVRYLGPGTGNSSASFRNDRLSCTTCATQVLVNSTSSAIFTNVSFDRSKVLLGNDEAFGPNNLTVQWYADVNVSYANGTPAASKFIALSDSLGRYMNAALRTDSGGAASVTVPELFSTSLSYFIPNGTMERQFVNYSWNTSAPGGWMPSSYSCTMYNSSSRVHSGNSSWYINSSVGGLCYPYANLAPSYLYAGGSYLISGWFYNASTTGQPSGRVIFGLGTGGNGGNVASNCNIGTGSGSLPYGQWVYRNTTCVNPGIINGNQPIVAADINVYGPVEIYADDLAIVPLAGAIATDNMTYVTYNYTPHQFEVKNAANVTNNWTYAFITNPSNYAADIFVPLVFATNASGGEGGIASGCMNVTANTILIGNVTKQGAYNPLPGQACINITADNVVLDCKGAWITGNDNENTTGIWTARNNVTVKNCNVQNFSYGIFSQGKSTSILNNSVYVPMNSTVNAQEWQGIELKASIGGNISGNTVYAYTSALQTVSAPPYRPDAILLWNAANSTVSNNNVYSYGSNSVAVNVYSSSNYNNISGNYISTNSSSGMGVYIYAACTGNNIYSNAIGTSGSNGYGIYLLSNSNLNNISFNNVTTAYNSASEGAGAQAIYVQTGNNTIAGNIVNTTGAYGYGVWLSGVNAANNSVTSNSISTSASNGNGIYANVNANNDYISFNSINISGGSSYAIYASGANSMTVFSNTVNATGSAMEAGFRAASSWYDNVSYNNFSTSVPSGFAIRLANASNYAISNNNLNASGSTSFALWLAGATSNITCSSNVFSTAASAVVELGYGGDTTNSYANNSASFANDVLTCTACIYHIYVNESSTAMFTNETFSRSKVSVLSATTPFSANNATFYWYVDVYLANNGGNPRKSTWANITDTKGDVYSNITGNDGIAHFAVAEFMNLTNSSGNYLVNYTPHTILALDNSNQTAASTALNVTGYQFVTMTYN